jgi:AraC-like DNA-binding protein
MSLSPAADLELEPRAERVTRRACAGRSVESGPRHQHTDFELTWVEAGHLAFDLGRSRRPIEIAAGACVLLPPGFVVTPRTRSAVVHQVAIPASSVDEASALLGHRGQVSSEPHVLGADQRLAQLVRLFMQEAGSGLIASDPFAASLFDAVVHGIARETARLPAPNAALDRRIRRALAAMEAGYRERLSVDDLAAAAGMNRFSFLRAFHAQVGTSPYQHLTTVRLERAAEQLRASAAASVLDIALGCGFTDPGRFSRAFRARYGCTPRAYRAAN